MTKRILATGNGNEMLEATPHGVVRWTWDARQKRYAPLMEDWASSYGKQLRESGITVRDVCQAVVWAVVTSTPDNAPNVINLPEDDYFGAMRP